LNKYPTTSRRFHTNGIFTKRWSLEQDKRLENPTNGFIGYNGMIFRIVPKHKEIQDNVRNKKKLNFEGAPMSFKESFNNNKAKYASKTLFGKFWLNGQKIH